ncbi:hypothetical protein Tco_0583320, partial [Tanacetum coccineum]
VNISGPCGELDETPILPDGRDTTKTVETNLGCYRVHKFCDATLKRVLEGLKSYNNDVKYGYVTHNLSKEGVEYLQLFAEEIEERIVGIVGIVGFVGIVGIVENFAFVIAIRDDTSLRKEKANDNGAGGSKEEDLQKHVKQVLRSPFTKRIIKFSAPKHIM